MYSVFDASIGDHYILFLSCPRHILAWVSSPIPATWLVKSMKSLFISRHSTRDVGEETGKVMRFHFGEILLCDHYVKIIAAAQRTVKETT